MKTETEKMAGAPTGEGGERSTQEEKERRGTDNIKTVR